MSRGSFVHQGCQVFLCSGRYEVAVRAPFEGFLFLAPVVVVVVVRVGEGARVCKVCGYYCGCRLGAMARLLAFERGLDVSRGATWVQLCHFLLQAYSQWDQFVGAQSLPSQVVLVSLSGKGFGMLRPTCVVLLVVVVAGGEGATRVWEENVVGIGDRSAAAFLFSTVFARRFLVALLVLSVVKLIYWGRGFPM